MFGLEKKFFAKNFSYAHFIELAELSKSEFLVHSYIFYNIQMAITP